jgi:hypothetical protein
VGEVPFLHHWGQVTRFNNLPARIIEFRSKIISQLDALTSRDFEA